MLIKRVAPCSGNGLFVADAFSERSQWYIFLGSACVQDEILFAEVVAAALARRVVLYVAVRRALGRKRGAGC